MFVTREKHEFLSHVIELITKVGQDLKKGRAECVYQKATGIAFQLSNIQYNLEETLPIMWNGVAVGHERLDISVYGEIPIIIELKTVASKIKPEHLWQVQSYMRIKSVEFGMVVNFSTATGAPIEIVVLAGTCIYDMVMCTMQDAPSDEFPV